MVKKDLATYTFNTPIPAELGKSKEDIADMLTAHGIHLLESARLVERGTLQPSEIVELLLRGQAGSNDCLHNVNSIYRVDIDAILTQLIKADYSDSPEFDKYMKRED